MTDLFKELIQTFLSEAEDLVREGSQALMTLENESEQKKRTEQYQSLSRNLHTLKGSAATCGLMDVSELAHRLEDVLAPFKAEAAELPDSAADLLLKGLDRVQKRTQAHAQGKAANLHSLQKDFPELFGEVLDTNKTIPKKDSPAVQATVEDLGWRVQASQIHSMNRDVEQLRELHLSIEEHRFQLSQTISQFEKDHRQGKPLTAHLAAMDQVEAGLRHDSENTAALVENLEGNLQNLSSLSVGAAWNSLHRVLRDACRETNKKAQLSVLGSELRLDRQVLENMYGPLTHLVRNAVDHGIEDPKIRQDAGKHSQGVVTLRVEVDGNLARIEIADDGAGIDSARLRKKALKTGRLTSAQAQNMPDHELYKLLFESGFSTKEKVSHLSGRGVGLDVVRDQVKDLRGNLEIDSHLDHGTRFIITLPLEIGALPLLIIRSGYRVFGIPTTAVDQVLSAKEDLLHLKGSRTKLKHRDAWIPCTDLGGLLQLRAPQAPEKGNALLVIQHNGERIALRVDHLLGDSERVILPLPGEIGSSLPYQGASVHRGRELLLVLKPSWLVREGSQPQAGAQHNRILVIDDSLTARAMHRSILESGGYLVHAVGSARQGLEILKKGDFKAVVCDVQMAGMDGLAFTREIRRQPWGTDIPILLVSTADSKEAVQQGFLAGASAYISKMDCADGNLLREMQRLQGAL